MTVPLLIDTDPGIDDALALLLALASPEVSVEAITTVAGNVPVERATENVFRILEVAAPGPRPRVAQGAAGPLRRSLVTADHVHGPDGLGGIAALREPDGQPRYPAPSAALETRDAADLILETAGAFRDRLVVAALGPLTNLATALRRDRARLARVARVVVMGGAVTVPGNITPAAEFNFYVDPEAAAAVLEAGLPLDLVPLDVTRQVVLTEAALEGRLGRRAGRLAAFVRDLARHGFAWGRGGGEGGIVLHDPLAVGAVLDPTLLDTEELHVAIETEGSLTRGLSLADRRAIAPDRKRPPNCRVGLRVDAARFLPLFLERLCPASA